MKAIVNEYIFIMAGILLDIIDNLGQGCEDDSKINE